MLKWAFESPDFLALSAKRMALHSNADMGRGNIVALRLFSVWSDRSEPFEKNGVHVVWSLTVEAC